MSEITICVNCKHVDISHAPHFYRCKAVSRETADLDPVTGRVTYKLDGGRTTIWEHPQCEDINKGDCPHYEAVVSED